MGRYCHANAGKEFSASIKHIKEIYGNVVEIHII